MARTSRRYVEVKEERKERFIYKAAIYTRLSNDRTEEWRAKSSSIETQVLACKEYALNESIDIVGIYTDYEYSGTNFDRPEFQRMMGDIKGRKINCIIIRDLSRLGREYLEMGRLIDKVFPFLGVRFISVSDKVDTVKEIDSKKSFEVTLKNIINDMYAKDISIKIKTSKQNRARNGYFVNPFAPFGYNAIRNKGGRVLEVDEKVRFIVEEMFELALQGETSYEIAKKMNKKFYATPKTYRKTGRIFREKSEPQWDKGSISKMLINPIYMGTLIQCIGNENETITYENSHEAIIPKEQFEKLRQMKEEKWQSILQGRKAYNTEKEIENRFKGLIFSSVTGKELSRRFIRSISDREKIQYIFHNQKYGGGLENKKTVRVFETDIDDAISKKVQEWIKSLSSEKRMGKQVAQRYMIESEIKNKTIKKLQDKILKDENTLRRLYEQYSLGHTNVQKYKEEREIIHNRIKTLKTEIIQVENQIIQLTEEKERSLKWISDVFSAEGIQKLPSELIKSLVEKILVYSNHHFEIVFKVEISESEGAICLK
ncbi:MAG: recombinase family protein [Peptostreptococcaceae bacterium]|nr:recombinase family protein [Peptostreptococcaceae bacterium]